MLLNILIWNDVELPTEHTHHVVGSFHQVEGQGRDSTEGTTENKVTMKMME